MSFRRKRREEAITTFSATPWAVILQAKNGNGTERRPAMETLFRLYWKPAYVYIRKSGYDVADAEDLTQEFFTRFLEKDFLRSVSPERGRFRSFLLVSIRHFLANMHDYRSAKKRGGGAVIRGIEAEGDVAAAEGDPEKAFLDQWVLDVMTRALGELRREVPPADFELLQGRVPPDLSPSDAKNRLFRIRQRLRWLICREILPSVRDVREAEAEIRELMANYRR